LPKLAGQGVKSIKPKTNIGVIMNKTHGPDAYKDIRKDRVLQVLEDSPRAIPAIRMKQPYRCPDKILPQIEKSHFGKRSTSINPVASTRLLDLPFTYK